MFHTTRCATIMQCLANQPLRTFFKTFPLRDSRRFDEKVDVCLALIDLRFVLPSTRFPIVNKC